MGGEGEAVGLGMRLVKIQITFSTVYILVSCPQLKIYSLESVLATLHVLPSPYKLSCSQKKNSLQLQLFSCYLWL